MEPKPFGRTQKIIISFVAIPFVTGTVMTFLERAGATFSSWSSFTVLLIGTGLAALGVGGAAIKRARAKNGKKES